MCDRRTFLANEYRYGVHEYAGLPVAHLRAQEMTVPGLFAEEADADAEAQRLYAGPLQLAQIRIKLQGYLIPLAAPSTPPIRVTGLQASRT